jgi:ribosome-interacting GTPase 1
MAIENILEFLGETRADEIKDHLMNTIMDDITDAIKNNYNYITPIDALAQMMDEVYEESYEELRKKYKKQLKGAMEKEILNYLEKYRRVKDAGSN